MSVYSDTGSTAEDASLVPVSVGDNGLGSLADELAALGDDYTSDEYDEGGAEGGFGEEASNASDDDDEVPTIDPNTTSTSPLPHGPASPSKRSQRSRRTGSESDSEFETPLSPDGSVSLGLEEKLNEIESLALRHRVLLKTEDDDDFPDPHLVLHPPMGEGAATSTATGVVGEATSGPGVISRVTRSLQSLPPQSHLETASNRLTTAHSALATNMLNQTRLLRELGFGITSLSLPPEDTDLLLDSLIDLIPRPMVEPLADLQELSQLTLSLASQLSFLGDSLHMARQSSVMANRKLRVAKEACADWKHETEEVEKARRWIEDGDWDGRLERREAAGVCGEVMRGFEGFCEGIEKRVKMMA